MEPDAGHADDLWNTQASGIVSVTGSICYFPTASIVYRNRKDHSKELEAIALSFQSHISHYKLSIVL
ncbi:hypothetical protein GY45DRAFT_1318268 [Cubamyces sp. BRFM 1775]|nr:hypothetical protein GY45DRAFT_1318268 [Cubamyces sp. BRFM 1775]